MLRLPTCDGGTRHHVGCIPLQAWRLLAVLPEHPGRSGLLHSPPRSLLRALESSGDYEWLGMGTNNDSATLEPHVHVHMRQPNHTGESRVCVESRHVSSGSN